MKAIHLSEQAYLEARRLAVAEGLQLSELLQQMIRQRLRKVHQQLPPPARPRPPLDRELNEWRQELL